MPAIRFAFVSLPKTWMPTLLLPETTFRALAVAPPIVLLLAPPWIETPSCPFARAAVPGALSPM